MKLLEWTLVTCLHGYLKTKTNKNSVLKISEALHISHVICMY